MDYFNNLIQGLESQVQQPEIPGVIISMVVSSVSSVLLYFLYETFYKYKHTGSQIHRSFFIIGPSITGIFIAIQFSLPLSLGLLGALSFIRFRTPIKDPEEVGYMFALVAVAILSATFNFVHVLILFAAIVGLLVVKERFMDGRFTGHGFGYVLLNVTADKFDQTEAKQEMVKLMGDAQLITVNGDENEYQYQYTFRDTRGLDRSLLIQKLSEIEGVLSVDVSFSNRPVGFVW